MKSYGLTEVRDRSWRLFLKDATLHVMAPWRAWGIEVLLHTNESFGFAGADFRDNPDEAVLAALQGLLKSKEAMEVLNLDAASFLASANEKLRAFLVEGETRIGKGIKTEEEMDWRDVKDLKDYGFWTASNSPQALVKLSLIGTVIVQADGGEGRRFLRLKRDEHREKGKSERWNCETWDPDNPFWHLEFAYGLNKAGLENAAGGVMDLTMGARLRRMEPI